ncbi:PDDEXK nuclease domain-containing protein, partial [Paraburkholderia sp. RL18-101-BIB-B]|uniref:PDDEXK nuclease domain-containing protein n=1 Tax=Paraburkholderia sp. RL18-101-BIB-B TaxID=3031634 RepID=UPI0038BCDFA2
MRIADAKNSKKRTPARSPAVMMSSGVVTLAATASNLYRAFRAGQPDVLLKDPYVLDFLGLNDHYLEKDLQDAILREMQQFLLELGAG